MIATLMCLKEPLCLRHTPTQNFLVDDPTEIRITQMFKYTRSGWGFQALLGRLPHLSEKDHAEKNGQKMSKA